MKLLYDYIKNIKQILVNQTSKISEGSSTYELYSHVTGETLKKLLSLGIDSIFDYFKSSLRITISEDFGRTQIFNNTDEMRTIIEEIEAYEDDELLKVIFKVDKNMLLKEKFNFENDKFTLKLFTSKSNLCNFLKDNSIYYIQNQMFNSFKKLYILVGDLKVNYENDYLGILGNNINESYINNLKNKDIETNYEHVNKVVSIRGKEIKKSDNIKYIIPEFFCFENIDDQNLHNILLKKACDLIVMYLSEDVNSNENCYLCEFNGYKNLNIIIDDNIDYELTNNSIENLYDLYRWAYKSNFTDKIMIVRNIISKYLKEDEANNYLTLLKNSEEIFKSIQANYRVFFEEKIDDFFEDRKKVAQYTLESTKELEKEISNLAKTISQNILTAIGVVLTAVITNSLNSSLNVKGIKIAIIAYITYIVVSSIYNLLIPMILVKQQYKDNKDLSYYFTVFLPDKIVNDVRGKIVENKLKFFYICWGISLFIIAILIGISIYAFINLEYIYTTFVQSTST